jgi:hypothetical protein
LPLQSEHVYAYPDVLQPGRGGSYRTAGSVGCELQQQRGPLPLVLQQQVGGEERRVGKLQRGYRGV